MPGQTYTPLCWSNELSPAPQRLPGKKGSKGSGAEVCEVGFWACGGVMGASEFSHT